jgi:phage head maturation protease
LKVRSTIISRTRISERCISYRPSASPRITDDVAWGKVRSGTYKGFSIGGKTLARDPDDKKIITKVRLDEISLVDRPSNPEARFDVWKAAGLHDGADTTAGLAKTPANATISPRNLPTASAPSLTWPATPNRP